MRLRLPATPVSCRCGFPGLAARTRRSSWGAAILLAWTAHVAVAAGELELPSVVVATVDGQPITAGELQREVDRAVKTGELPPAARPAVRAAALNQLIDRRLVAAYLKQNGLSARPQEVEREMQRIRARLQQQAVTLDQYLQRAGLTSEELRRSVEWEIGWPRFMEQYLTDENLARFFQQHRREFDGTEIAVAHILVRVDSPDDPRSRESAVAAAEQLRRRIEAGELTFAEAARQHSAAPTAADGGRIGFIGRREPMPESFSQAAFALEPGQISPAVATSFGVHLIQCLEIKPGSKRWQDVRDQLVPAVTQHLFHWAAERQRPQTKIEIPSTSQAPK